MLKTHDHDWIERIQYETKSRVSQLQILAVNEFSLQIGLISYA